MDDLTSATGISGATSGITIGAVIWYIKGRILKYEKANNKLKDELREATLDNKVQEKEIEAIKEQLREIRKHLYNGKT